MDRGTVGPESTGAAVGDAVLHSPAPHFAGPTVSSTARKVRRRHAHMKPAVCRPELVSDYGVNT